MEVPFLNPAAQFAGLREEILPAVENVLAGGRYILGPELEAFEREVAHYVGVRCAVGVNSGSDALTMSLRALGVGPSDEVITTPFTYIAPAEAIYQAGAKIVFADIEPDSFNLNPDEVLKRIGPSTKAIIPVHLFGQAAALGPILEAAKERGIAVVEDCAQAIGATREGRRVGGMGATGCFSFYPTKNLGAAGDGGMIVTDDEALAMRLRMLRVHGIERRYYHDLHGYNSRLDELQAAVLRVKLRRLDGWNERRRQIAARYTEGLRALPLQTPQTRQENTHIFHVYAVLAEQRDALQRFLHERGVPTLIYYPEPLHLQQVYSDYGWAVGDFPVAESVSRRILPLPMYPELADEQVDYVIDVIHAFYGR